VTAAVGNCPAAMMLDKRALLIPALLIAQALLVHWVGGRESPPPPLNLSAVPAEFGNWKQIGENPIAADVAREIRVNELRGRTTVSRAETRTAATRATPALGCTPTARAVRRSTSQHSVRASAYRSRPSTPSTRPRSRPPSGALSRNEVSVLVALAPCILMDRSPHEQVVVDDDRCNLCGLCVELGCPALVAGPESIQITSDCTGCGVCLAVCARGAISLPVAAGGGDETP